MFWVMRLEKNSPHITFLLWVIDQIPPIFFLFISLCDTILENILQLWDLWDFITDLITANSP